MRKRETQLKTFVRSMIAFVAVSVAIPAAGLAGMVISHDIISLSGTGANYEETKSFEVFDSNTKYDFFGFYNVENVTNSIISASLTDVASGMKVFEYEKTIVQRFGDPNQSIYNKVRLEKIWKPRKPLKINSSRRFGENIASVLRTVCIEDNSKLKSSEAPPRSQSR